MPVWESERQHSYYIDGDLVYWRLVGLMDESDIKVLLTAVDKVLSDYQYSLLLVDCTEAQNLTAEARRRYAEWLRNNPFPRRTSVFFAAKGDMQTFLELARRAGELLSGKRSAMEVVADEATAQQRIAEARAEWQAEAPPTSA